MANLNIRRFTNTPTLQSLLYVRYLRQISTWGAMQPFAYLSRKIELDNAFSEFDTEIYTLIRDLSINTQHASVIIICDVSHITISNGIMKAKTKKTSQQRKVKSNKHATSPLKKKQRTLLQTFLLRA